MMHLRALGSVGWFVFEFDIAAGLGLRLVFTLALRGFTGRKLFCAQLVLTAISFRLAQINRERVIQRKKGMLADEKRHSCVCYSDRDMVP